MMVPSQTKRGEAWLENFHRDDRETGRLLLDSIAVTPWDDVRRELRKRIVDLDGTAVLVPVQSMEDVKFRGVSDVAQAVAYQHFSPGDDISVTPGSEGVIGGLVRDLVRERGGATRLHPSVPLDELKTQKCRSLVFITDYAGSGKQVLDYVQAFLNNRTIRSWRSGGYLDVRVVAYAASRRAETLIARTVDRCHIERRAPSFDTVKWSERERRDVEALCKKYANGKRGDALGYKGSGGLYVSTISSVPNNIPYILRRIGGAWSPFFEGRVFPDDLRAELAGYAPPSDMAKVVESVGKARVANALRAGRHGRVGNELLGLISIIYVHPRSDLSDLSHLSGLPVSRVERLVDFLRSCGLVDEHLRVTVGGLYELRVASRMPRRVPGGVAPFEGVPYYPQSLR